MRLLRRFRKGAAIHDATDRTFDRREGGVGSDIEFMTAISILLKAFLTSVFADDGHLPFGDDLRKIGRIDRTYSLKE